MAEKPRILVIGAGPAGLSAAVHLLEEAGRDVRVELVFMGHHLGGKAKSWRDAEGFSVDHGFHAVFGFYEEMKSLARRAGVDLSKALVKSRGVTRYFDDRSGQIIEFDLARNGWVMLYRFARFPGLTPTERRQLADAAARMARTVSRAPSLEVFDDVCYRAFMLEHGAPPGFLRHPVYRETQDLLFNVPHEISAYIALKGSQLLGHCYYDATYDYVAGGLSERFWDPIARYVERLGGALRIRQKLVRLEIENGKLTACHFGIPDNDRFHQNGKNPWPAEVPIAEGTSFRDAGAAAVICTLPAACFTELNPGDPIWSDPFFGNMRNLTSVSTLSLQLWLKRPILQRAEGTIGGLPLPLSYVIDYKRIVPEFRQDPRYGAALEWVGAEGGVAPTADVDLVAAARRDLARVPGFEGTDRDEVVHRVFMRNRANHNRYLLTDPGTLRFRPTVETPVKGLFLAGDWVRNEIDVPTMEGAIRCGKRAARLALKSI